MLPKFNQNSSVHLSALFFGGWFTYTTVIPLQDINQNPIVFKNGKPRYTKITKKHWVPGLRLKPLTKWAGKRKGVYSVNEEVLSCIASSTGQTDNALMAIKIAQTMLQIRTLTKELATYYTATQKALESDHCVRGQFQMVVSDTGRTSCVKPALQTQPNVDSVVRQHFTSRFLDGVIVSADWSQIEVVVQAELSQDHKYMEDLLIRKIDFHCKRLALKEQKEYLEVVKLVKQDVLWAKKRKQIKSFSFGRNYRAQPTTLAKKSGLSVQECWDLIMKERLEYPILEAYNERRRNHVEKYGYYTGLTGKIYYFTKKPYQDYEYHRRNTYRYPEIVNYEIQGTATDIALIMLGRFWRTKALFKRDHYLLVNFVHDEIVLDVKQIAIQETLKDCKMLDKVREMMYSVFNYDWHTPIELKVVYGLNWLEGLEIVKHSNTLS